MWTTLMTILVVTSLLLGGAGATVYAAQDSLPSEPLYSVKAWQEQARLQLAVSEQSRFELALEYANRRSAEVEKSQELGLPIQETLQTRLQEQLNLALHLAAGMPDPQMQPALEQFQAQVQEQLQTMSRLQAQSGGTGDPALEQIRHATRLRLAAMGRKIQRFRYSAKPGTESNHAAARPARLRRSARK
jgi:hypothetical protein